MAKTFDDCKPKITELVELIRNKQPSSTSLFLALYETLPRGVWSESVRQNILSAREFQACILVLKQYRKLQAKSAIKTISKTDD
jgi:hypothetical protein